MSHDLFLAAFGLSLVAVFVLATELRDRNYELCLERDARQRLARKLAQESRAVRRLPAPMALRATEHEPKALDTAAMAPWSDPPVIDLPHDAAHTVEHELFRPSEENASAN